MAIPVDLSSSRTRDLDGDRAAATRLSHALIAARDQGGDAPPAPPLALTTGGSWDAMLEEWVRQVPAIAAFIVDDRGLLMAAAGALAANVLEGSGARLAEALRHLEHLPATTAASRTVLVEYDGEWLTGIRVHHGDGELIIGVIGDRPMTPTARAMLRATLTGTV